MAITRRTGFIASPQLAVLPTKDFYLYIAGWHQLLLWLGLAFC
jgi:hypothetical protein